MIFASTLHIDILFIKKQLNLPSKFVNRSNQIGTHFKQVGQKLKFTLQFSVIKSYFSEF